MAGGEKRGRSVEAGRECCGAGDCARDGRECCGASGQAADGRECCGAGGQAADGRVPASELGRSEQQGDAGARSPQGLTELESLNFFDDGEARRALLQLSYVLLGVAVALGVVLALAGAFNVPAEIAVLSEATGLGFGLSISAWGALLLVVSVVVLPVHELIHGACFKLLSGGRAKVTYGFSAGMLYAGCPGVTFPRAAYVVVLLAPAVLLSAALLAAGVAAHLPLLGYVAFAFHLAGCAGDLYATRRIHKTPRCTHCEDTTSGLRLLGE